MVDLVTQPAVETRTRSAAARARGRGDGQFRAGGSGPDHALTGGVGADRAIDAVGVDAQHARHGPAGKAARPHEAEFAHDREQIGPDAIHEGEPWIAGGAAAQALDWAVESLCKAGQLSIIGVYPPSDWVFPIGKAMNKTLTIKMGDCTTAATTRP